MNEFLGGVEAMGFAVAALYFLRFWRDTRDVLFLLFAVAFVLEGASHTALALEGDPLEARPVFYLPRLLAYLLIHRRDRVEERQTEPAGRVTLSPRRHRSPPAPARAAARRCDRVGVDATMKAS